MFGLLIIGDCCLAVLAVIAGFAVRFEGLMPHHVWGGVDVPRILIFLCVTLFVSFLMDLYSREKELGRKEILVRVGTGLAVSFFVLSAVFFVMPSTIYGRGVFVLSLAAFGVFQLLWHLGYRMLKRLPGLAKRVLILGTGPLADRMGGVLASRNGAHVLVGYVPCANEPRSVPEHRIVKNGGRLIETVCREKAEKLVVSLSERRGAFPLQDLLDCKFSGIEVVDAPTFYEEVTGKMFIENITPSWFIYSSGFRINSARKRHKRLFDIACSSAGLLLALPLFPFIALLIKLDSQGPAFFRQVRLGEGERRFGIYKFRTMRRDSEQASGPVWAQKDDPRCTRVGKVLRRTRLDELPQLFNVLKGEMSIVGPRPERPEFVEDLKKMIPYYSERHCVKPGITGWAQVKYSYGASVEDATEKLRYDLYYVKNISFLLDLVIVIETVKVVLFRRGAQ